MVSEGSRRASERPFSTPAPPASRALKRRRRVTGYLTCGNGKARITLRRRETARRRPPCADPLFAGQTLRHRPVFGAVSGVAAKIEKGIRARDARAVSALVTALLPGRRWPRASERPSGSSGSKVAGNGGSERAPRLAADIPGSVTAGHGPCRAQRGPRAAGPIPVIPRAKRGGPIPYRGLREGECLRAGAGARRPAPGAGRPRRRARSSGRPAAGAPGRPRRPRTLAGRFQTLPPPAKAQTLRQRFPKELFIGNCSLRRQLRARISRAASCAPDSLGR